MIAHFIATVASYQNLYTVQIGLRRWSWFWGQVVSVFPSRIETDLIYLDKFDWTRRKTNANPSS